MTAVDYAAEARRIIHESTHDGRGPVSLDLLDDHELAEYHASMVEAHTHATLALVEQTRIANLIALSQATNPDGSRVSPEALTHPVGEYSVAINEDIKKGLGL